jgi:hypothetical protein
MSQKLYNKTPSFKIVSMITVILFVTGCATSNDLLDEDLSGNARAEAARWSQMWEQTPVVVDPQKVAPTVAPEKSFSGASNIPQSSQQQTSSRLTQTAASEGLVQPMTDRLGIHIATFSFEEDIETGLNAIRRVLPDTIKSKQARAAIVDISGTNYYHLILGPYNSATDASTDCGIIVQNVDFCEVVDFTGEATK